MTLELSILLTASSTLLALILLWALYHIPILISGLRSNNTTRTAPHPSLGDTDALPSFTIIVPAKDEAPFIKRCLEALLAMDYPKERMEVIVVEGGSRDETYSICREFAEAHPTLVHIVRQETPDGKPSALNLGLRRATGDVVAVFDADSIPEKDVLKKAASRFQDPSLVALQGRTRSLYGESNSLARISSLEEEAWFRTLLRGRERMGLFIPLTGSCQFIRRNVLAEMGGWDEHSLAEDVELAARLLLNGYRVEYAHDICSWQEAPSSFRSFFTQRMRWFRGYMETALRYGRLLGKPSWRRLDAEVLLSGPFMMSLCLASYVLWGLSIISPTTPALPFPNPAMIATLLTGVSLTSIGLSLTLYTKPFNLKSLRWVPLIYLYWLLETFIAGWSLIQIVLRRPRVWRKTEKSRYPSNAQIGRKMSPAGETVGSRQGLP
jgi:cellulose synthase/poly-beta-1,6-N-acetylglucosamine synthase-like glycosyltransferase